MEVAVPGREPPKLEESCPLRRSLVQITSRDTAFRELMLGGKGVPLTSALLHRRVLEDVGYFDERLTGRADDYNLVIRMAAAGVPCVSADSRGRFSVVQHPRGGNVRVVVIRRGTGTARRAAREPFWCKNITAALLIHLPLRVQDWLERLCRWRGTPAPGGSALYTIGQDRKL